MNRRPSASTALSRRALGLGLVASWLAVGCASPDDGAGAPAFLAGSGSFEAAMRGVRSVSLHPRARIVRPRPGQSAAVLRSEMDRALVEAFGARGVAVVDAEELGERVIAYAIGIEGELSDREMVEIFGIAPGVDTDPSHLRGGLVVAVVHAKTGRVLWRGSASATVEDLAEGSPERLERIRAALRAILGDRPAPSLR